MHHSDSRQALTDLRLSESRYRRLFETARDGIFLLNADTAQIEDVNPYLLELLGYSRAECLGKKLWELGAFADIPASKEMFALLQENGYVRYKNLPLKASSGREVPVEVISNSYDCEGTRVIQCNIRDISAQVAAERVLQEFKAIVDGSDDAIISKSLDGCIRSWNAGAEQLFGYSAHEAIGASITMLIPPDRKNEEDAILARVISGERVEYFETRRLHKDGSQIDVGASVSPIRDGDGIVVGASTVARNVSAKKRAEAVQHSLELRLLESQKIAAIGTLAGGIAHDFINILATIIGNVELAWEDCLHNPEASRGIDEIRKAADRARESVRQILSFCRHQPLERKPIRLAAVVEESVRLLRATLPAGVQINASCGPGTPPVLADANQIEQVLLNLATNAMQAAGHNAQRIDIRLDTVVLDGSSLDDARTLATMRLSAPALVARLTVSDIGPGMNEATLARIFEPFFTTKPMGGGTGLGLSVVQGIVHAHDGAIVASSTIGEGTTFMIHLPTASAFGAPPNGGLGVHKTGRGMGRRLLYIDDDASVVDLMQRLLERREYIVTAFTDPRAAIDALRRDPFAYDLVVTDYNMPYLSGLDVARAVRDIRGDLPVAVTSGFVDQRLMTLSEAAGVRELIDKPIDSATLCDQLERLVGSTTGR